MNNKQNNSKLELYIHILIWIVLFFLPASFSWGTGRTWTQLFTHFWLQLILMAVVFYLNYFLLVKWLFSDRKVLFFITNLLLLVAVIYLKNEIFSYFQSSRPPVPRKKDGFGPPKGFRYYIDFLIYLIPVAFAIAINSGKRIQQAEKMRQEADNIKLESELQHLKYQLQPHFFFNALNNIYSMIDFAPEKAKQSIHSLSKLMRHLLQKSDMESISLSEEIDFLNKYIDLMALRLNDKTKVYTDFPGKVPHLRIAPLLFISIVENAFKHGVSATQPSDISFKMEVQDGEICFTASNSNFPKNEADKSGSGIGIENLRKRLQILYPDHHEFSSCLNKGMYIAELKIETDFP